MTDETLLDYFDEERLERFIEAMNEGLGQFGADNQEVLDYFELACGSPYVEMREFPTEPVARMCRDKPVDEWAEICRRVIHRWVDGTDQRDWMAAQPFADIAGRLRPWLSNKREIAFKGDPDGPEQPWSRELLPDCWLSLFVDAPSLAEEMPAYPEFVPNKAVAAWDVSPEELIEAARDRLRSLPPPKWQSNFYEHSGDDEPRYGIEMLYLEENEETDPIAAAWQLVLAEVAPKPLLPGTLISSPARQILMLSYPDPNLTVEQRRAVFDEWTDRMWAHFPRSRVQGWSMRVDPGDKWRIMES